MAAIRRLPSATILIWPRADLATRACDNRRLTGPDHTGSPNCPAVQRHSHRASV